MDSTLEEQLRYICYGGFAKEKPLLTCILCIKNKKCRKATMKEKLKWNWVLILFYFSSMIYYFYIASFLFLTYLFGLLVVISDTFFFTNHLFNIGTQLAKAFRFARRLFRKGGKVWHQELK